LSFGRTKGNGRLGCTKADTDRKASSIVRRDVSISGAVRLSQIPYSTLKERVNINDTQNALRNRIKTIFAGYPTVYSVGEGQDFTAGLKVLTGRTLLGGSAGRRICLLI